MPNEPGKETPDPKDGQELAPAAAAIIDAVKDALKPKEGAPDPKAAPAPRSEPAAQDPAAIRAAWRENTKKKMGWTDEQVDLQEQTLLQAQAPILKSNAITGLRTTHKDFDQLEKPFLEEIARYEKMGRIIDPHLAEELFYKVKGVELTAGRYKLASGAPESQPQRKPDAGRDGRPIVRISRGYDAADPGQSGGSGGGTSQQMTEVEQDYLRFLQQCGDQIGFEITPESYMSAREDKRNARRNITDKTVRRMEVGAGANPADRDLAALWNRNATERVAR